MEINKYLFEVSFDLLIFNFLGDSSDENLFDGLTGIGVVSSLAGCRALGLNLTNKKRNKYYVDYRNAIPTMLAKSNRFRWTKLGMFV